MHTSSSSSWTGRAIRVPIGISLVLALLAAWGCVSWRPLPEEQVKAAYAVPSDPDSLLARYAPVFVTHGHESAHNRIGSPRAVAVEPYGERIYVDPEEPAVFAEVRTFQTDKGSYTNLIYRVHFPEVPFSLVPFYLTAGQNTGLILVVTLSAKSEPVLVTSVHTCGCYAAITPTRYLPEDALPQGWKAEPVEVYGEKLPWILDYGAADIPRLLAHLRPDLHRVMDLEVVEGSVLEDPRRFRLVPMPLKDVHTLERLPLEGAVTSLYHSTWPMRGHVKGAYKAWETFLLGPLSLDLFVGTDKVYGEPEDNGNPFYTSLKPWNRGASDMRRFARFLTFWGWRL